jgi:hypothetical protein
MLIALENEFNSGENKQINQSTLQFHTKTEYQTSLSLHP